MEARSSWARAGCGFCFLVLAYSAEAAVAEADLTKLPPAAAKKIDFGRDIQPIFEHSCFRCHGIEKPKSGFQLISRESALKGGRNGVDIIPGKGAESPLVQYTARLVAEMEMPPEGKGDPLSSEQVGLLRAWIDQGASWSATPLVRQEQFKFSVSPTVGWFHVDGNKQQFRADTGLHENASGGLESFYLKEQLDDRTSVTSEGHLLFGTEDYRMSLEVNRRDLGFIRLGAEQYRKWFDDSGGFEPVFAPPIFRLGEDLHLDVGRAWFDVGLAIPSWPKVTLGYEYQNKEGSEATLHWGDVSNAAGFDKKIYPAARELHEQVHVMKLDAEHDVAGIHLEDNFRAELYDLNSRQLDPVAYNADTAHLDKMVLAQESEDHFQAANSIRLEKQVRDWLFLSGGYLYSQLNGEAAFDQTTFLTPASTASLFSDDKFWAAHGILLEQSSHIFNANAMLGPWQGLTVQTGVQSEWMRQRGVGDVQLDLGRGTPFETIEFPHLDSNLDRADVQELIGFRYTTIPYTVVFGEARLEQESIGQFEEQVGGIDSFLRDTDATSQLEEFRTGFTVSPWTRVALDVQYKHRDRRTAYDHLRDEMLPSGAPNPGYSAFLRWRDLETDEVAAKFIVRWSPRWKTTVSYRVVATDYSMATDPFINDFVVPPDVITTGARHLSGQYDSHIYGIDTTVNPIVRLHLTGAFSYQQNRTTTDHPALPAVADYSGGVYSAMAAAFFNVNAKTDLKASYNYSWADYSQNNYTDGLPMGIQYSRHGVQAGVSRRISKNITGHLQYAFFAYDEPTRGGANNYTAHGVFTTLSIVLP